MDSDTPETIFRAPKRRKIFRARQREEEDTASGSANTAPQRLPAARDDETLPAQLVQENEEQSSVADIIRRRKAGKQRKVGIEFSNTKAHPESSSFATQSTAIVPAHDGKNVLEVAASRFTAQTGQVADVMDQHM